MDIGRNRKKLSKEGRDREKYERREKARNETNIEREKGRWNIEIKRESNKREA